MTQTLPALVVSIDREAAIRLRRSIRTGRTVSAWATSVLGAIGIVGTVTLLITAVTTMTADPIFVIFFALPVLMAAGLFAFGVHQFRVIARQGAYWRAEDLPDRAFVVTSDGLEIASDGAGGIQEIGWASVVGLRFLKRKLEFTVVPGTLPQPSRTALSYGYAVLDQDRAVIADAVRRLSGDRVIAQ